jgi:ethanolamine ammonia-lyase large subunit
LSRWIESVTTVLPQVAVRVPAAHRAARVCVIFASLEWQKTALRSFGVGGLMQALVSDVDSWAVRC